MAMQWNGHKPLLWQPRGHNVWYCCLIMPVRGITGTGTTARSAYEDWKAKNAT